MGQQHRESPRYQEGETDRGWGAHCQDPEYHQREERGSHTCPLLFNPPVNPLPAFTAKKLNCCALKASVRSVCRQGLARLAGLGGYILSMRIAQLSRLWSSQSPSPGRLCPRGTMSLLCDQVAGSRELADGAHASRAVYRSPRSTVPHSLCQQQSR